VNPIKSKGAGSVRDELIAILAIVLPCLIPDLNSLLQLFMPGIAAVFLNFGAIKRRLVTLLVTYIIGSSLFLYLGMVASSLVLAQVVVICGVLLISVWKNVEAPKTVVVMSVAMFAMAIVLIGFASNWNIYNLYSKMVTAMTAEYDKAVALYKKSASSPLPAQLDEFIVEVKQTLIDYFPGIICSFFVLLSFSNTITFMRFNTLKGRARNLTPDFDRWQMPWWLVWAFIVSGFMALMPNGVWPFVGKNGVLVVCIFYLIQGFSIMKFFFKVMETPVYIRYLVYALIGIQWYGLLLVVFTGLMDNWFDFRARLEKKSASGKDDQA